MSVIDRIRKSGVVWRQRRIARRSRFILFAAAAFLVARPLAFAGTAEDWDICRQRDDADRAVAACSRVIEAKPEPSDLVAAYLLRGGAYHMLSQYGPAVADFSEVIRLEPKNVMGYYLRSFAFQGRGEYASAIIDYAEAYRIDPRIGAGVGFGIIASGRRETGQMIADFSEAIRRDPHDVIAYLYRGCAYTAQAKYDQALADFDEAIRLDPKNADAYFGRSETYMDRRDWDRARADMNAGHQLQQSSTP
jgi:tetratricopeptide (TPR) repeat protein